MHTLSYQTGLCKDPIAAMRELFLLRFEDQVLILYDIRVLMYVHICTALVVTLNHSNCPASSSRWGPQGMAEKSHKEASTSHSRPEDGLGKEELQSATGYIAIKGTRNGLLLTLEPETPFSELLNALADRLAKSPSFFRGASLAVDTSRRALRLSERHQLENLLAYYQMSVAAADSPSNAARARATKTINLPENEPATDGIGFTIKDLGGAEQRDPRESEDTLFLRRTVRSGQAIHHASNIVVLGDINPGAEIVAGGDIIVWGVTWNGTCRLPR